MPLAPSAEGRFPGSPGIYAIYCVGNDRLYVGKATNLANRKADHLWKLRNNRHANTLLQRSFDKYGEDSLVFRVVASGIDVSALDEAEAAAVAELGTYVSDGGFNLMLPTGDGSAIMSEETKARIASSKVGVIPGRETRQRMSTAQKGRRHNPASIEKMREAKVGKVHTLTAREKMSHTHASKAPLITHEGHSAPLRAWAASAGMSPQALRRRLKLGWDFADAITTPLEPRNNQNAISPAS